MNVQRLRIIDALSALGLTAAAMIAVWPVHLRATTAVPFSMSPVELPAPDAGTDNAEASVIVAANVMSSTRRAPAVRYRSPDVEAMQGFAAPTGTIPAAVPATDGVNGADVVPMLYGIVSIDGTPRALLRLSSGDASPALFREGDHRGAYRVARILSDRVTLASSSGQRTLRLARGAARDTTTVSATMRPPESGKRP